MTAPATRRDDRDTGAPPATLLQTTSAYGYSAAGTATASTGRGNRRGRRTTAVLLGAVVPVALVVLWQLIAISGWVPAYKLPSPATVWQSAGDLWVEGRLGRDIAISTQRVIIGFLVGSALGLLIGSLVGLSRLSSLLLSPTIGGLRAVPSLAWVPLLILYIGINEDSKIALITIGAFFPVYTTVAGALRHVDPHLVEVGRAYGLTRGALLTRVQLPAIIPSVVSGLRLALAQSWLFLVAAELISSSMGLGFLLTDSQNNGRLDRIFVAILVLAVLGKATDALIGLGERHLLRRFT